MSEAVVDDPVPTDGSGGDSSDTGAVDSGVVDWGGLLQGLEAQEYESEPESQEPAAQEPEVEPTAQAEPPPQEPEAAAPAVEDTPEQPPTPEPAQPEPEAQAPEPEAQPAQEPQETPQGPSPEDLAQLRQGYVSQLAERYKLTEDQETAFVSGNVNDVLPQLAAELHANVLEEVTQQVAALMHQAVPQILEAQLGQREARQRGETEFFEQWPELSKARDKVRDIVAAYRQLNPQASKEEVFRNAGIQAWMALGLDAADLARKLAGGAAPEPEPPPPPPRTPANPGGITAPADPQPTNPYEKLSFEFEEDF